MGCLRCCAFLVPAIAILGPLAGSVIVDGYVWDLLPGWRVVDMPALAGKVAIVTGPTINGIGFESAVEMARKGAHVILAGRSQPKGNEAMLLLFERVPTAKAEFMILDLASLKSVRAFASNFAAKGLPLHILINNAGIMANPFALTEDNLESQFATNHLGHFLLTKQLLPLLEQSAPSRIVTVSSAAAFVPEFYAKLGALGLVDAAPAADFDHLGPDYEATYQPFAAYGRSKLANVLFTRALARRLEGKEVYANVCHPGGIKTNLAKHVKQNARTIAGRLGELTDAMYDVLSMLLLSPSQGAVTQLFLATAAEVESKDIRGQYYRPQASAGSPPSFATVELEEKLWSISEKLVAG